MCAYVPFSSTAVIFLTVVLAAAPAAAFAMGVDNNYTIKGNMYSAPTVANWIVYVGCWDHNIYALSAGTGMKVWNYTTKGAIASSPAVANGIVYVGSYDGNIYALNARTGGKLWNYMTGA
jgi:outer membrane protein assembly factor BamB